MGIEILHLVIENNKLIFGESKDARTKMSVLNLMNGKLKTYFSIDFDKYISVRFNNNCVVFELEKSYVYFNKFGTC